MKSFLDSEASVAYGPWATSEFIIDSTRATSKRQPPRALDSNFDKRLDPVGPIEIVVANKEAMNYKLISNIY